MTECDRIRAENRELKERLRIIQQELSKRKAAITLSVSVGKVGRAEPESKN